MSITGTRVMTGIAGVVVATALGVGIAAGSSGTTPAPQTVDLDPTCVLGYTAQDLPAAAEPWKLGLLARSEALNRQYGLGRYVAGSECADLPQWFVALTLRSDAMNRAGGLGPYAGRGR